MPTTTRKPHFPHLLAALMAVLALAPAAARKEPLELHHVYGPDALDFSPDLPRIRWLPGGRDYLQAEDNEDGPGRLWQVVDAATGDTAPFYDPEPLARALEEQLRLGSEDAASKARPSSLRLSPATDRLLLQLASDLFVWDFDAETLTRLTHGPEEEELARFSPDGRSLAFVRDADLYVMDVEGNELRLTTDGGDDTLNGKLDWVYQEEIYGRGNYQAHWWSPDSHRIAFLQTDEREVPRFTVVDHVPYRPPLEVYPYPKAGDPNPRVRLGVVSAAGGDITWIDPGIYGHAEILFVNVAFSPDGDLWYQVQDRRQTFLDLHRADPDTGKSERVLREESHAWVNQLGPPHFLKGDSLKGDSLKGNGLKGNGLKGDSLEGDSLEGNSLEGNGLEDGGFLWLSERTRLPAPLPLRPGRKAGRGTDRRTLGGPVTQRRRRGGRRGLCLRRLPLGNRRRRAPGRSRRLRRHPAHRGTRQPPRQLPGGRPDRALDRHVERSPHTDDHDPAPRRRRCDHAGPRRRRRPGPRAVRHLAAGTAPDHHQRRRRPGSDAHPPAWLRPRAHLPRLGSRLRRPPRPAGPERLGRVLAACGSSTLAQQGIVVLVVDNRIASGKGVESTWPVYRNFGKQELVDLVEAVDWLGAKPWVDKERIGLDGWSFGGYMTLYALTRSDRFRAGIAGGSVVDWRAYDSIYTERYMSTPDDNPDGYKASSVRERAADLHGDLLLIHGTMDDNVHMQNTLQIAWDLQKAGKPFEMMLYPKSRHGISDPDLSLHLRETMARFILKTVEP